MSDLVSRPVHVSRGLPGLLIPLVVLLLALLLAALVTAAASPLAAQTAASPSGDAAATRQAARVLSAHRLAGEPPTIDGRIDEPVWASADAATGFTQIDPDLGAPATQRTEVRVLYDADAVYVAARMHDTAADSIVARLARRDAGVHSDWFHVGFDSYFDRRTAFVFGVNAAGVKQDLFLFDDSDEDGSWDAVWDAATSLDEGGWSAEFRIPLSQLRFDTGEDAGAWGVNFKRLIARSGEDTFWAPIPNPSEPKLVSLFGTLRGLTGLEPPHRLELQPYAVTSVTRAPGDVADPFHEANVFDASVGGDLKYGLSSDLTLTATINPDFGQIEADPSVVNLTAYETFFQERRPFFQEGANIFDFGIGLGDGSAESLFYSRRIGRAPQGSLPDDAAYGEMPSATTILGAAKLSGRTADGWSVGVLDALTASESAPFSTDDDGRGRRVVEPLTNYGVLRVVRDFRDGESAVGGIATAVNRVLDGRDHLAFLATSAYAGGLDARHRFAAGDWQVRGYAVGSLVNGEPEALRRVQQAPGRYFQRPDADHVAFDSTRTSLAGWSAQLELAKLGGGHWRGASAAQAISPGFEVNDLGFQTNRDLLVHAAFLGYDQYEAGDMFRRWNVNLNGWHGYTFGGERVMLGGNVNGWGELLSYWSLYGGIELNAANLSTDALRGGPALRTTPTLSFWGGASSDGRKTIRGSVDLSGSRDLENDGRRLSISPGLSWRASSSADLSLHPSVSLSTNDAQYIATRPFQGDDRYVFGRLGQTTVSLTTRLSYTFTPDLSLQFYAQPFVSAGDYTRFREVASPRAPAFDERFRTFAADQVRTADGRVDVDFDDDGTFDASFDDPDFNFKELRSTAVLRWEYLPGSTLYVVWSQSRTGFDRDEVEFELRRDFGRLLGLDSGYDVAGTNVLLVKVSYWLGA
ncbi:MAG: DUF5916 domain-containing protein [Longimicrobiales bacterium]